jgi:nicotinate-nucleotide adenylyltransferase
LGKIGIFGGTFDPIHNGHLITAERVCELRNLDKIIFIPCYISPLKQSIKSSAGKYRLELLKLAISDNPKFDYSDIELQKKSVSYSIDTINKFKKKYKEIDLIIGYDNLEVFDKWKEPDEIIKLVNLVVMKRKTDNGLKQSNKYFTNAICVDTPAIEISSTDIRERVRNNLSIRYLIPDKVRDYIYRYKLYSNQ